MLNGKTFVFAVILFLNLEPLFAQKLPPLTPFRSLEKALENPDSVKFLSIKKLPKDSVDSFLSLFKNLEILDLTGTRLEKFPVSICSLSSLRQIKLGKNQIDTVPECICNLNNLESIELWENNIFSLPDCLNEMSFLKVVDLLYMQFNQSEQDRLKERFPKIKLKLSTPCNCNFE